MNKHTRQSKFREDAEVTSHGEAVALQLPALVYREVDLCDSASSIRQIAKDAACDALYSLKACSIHDVLEILGEEVHGFACSSLFEACHAREVLRRDQTVHYSSPGIRDEEEQDLARVCDYISFNSLGQWRGFRPTPDGRAKFGIRVNPEMSFISDERYDPCRPHSKLGVPSAELSQALDSGCGEYVELSGLHFHSNCDSSDMRQLLSTVEHLSSEFPNLLRRVEWINLGGGYLLGEANHLEALHESVEKLRSAYNLEVFIEPGAAFVRRAGRLVSSVLDIFERGGKTIAILDATVNHMPEVFEYQFSPDVRNHVDGGPYRYVLAGCSCLAGDLFGDYAFEGPLELGSRVVFENVGAYCFTKAHLFNGINLPSLYVERKSGEIELIKKFVYEDYLARCGRNLYAASGT